jgi:amidophosphoribosyltransferase
VCGIIGIHGEQTISPELYYGLLGLQHRGQSAVGIITYDGHIHPEKEAGLVTRLMKGYDSETSFGDDHPGYVGIGHTRYSTSGSDDRKALKRNAQPEYIVNPFMAACHNGNIYNLPEMQAQSNRTPRTSCDIQFLLLPMADAMPTYTRIDFDNIVDSAGSVMEKVKGSYSALFLTVGRERPFMFVMTDPYKVRPLVLGQKDGTWYVSSESMVLKRLGVDEFTDVDSGTILTVTPGEDKPEAKKLIKKKKHLCMFEYVYFADPVSWIEKISVHNTRVALGKSLYKDCPANADLVVPIPESGRRYGIGFSHESGIPLEEGLKKDRKERAFIMQTQDQRSKWAERNLSAVDAALDGKDVVLTDDSLIRGTNITRVVHKVREAGAKSVHVRIGCPPIVAPCYLGIDMRHKTEFIAIDQEKNEFKSWEQIASEVGADSVGYNTLEALRKTIIGTRDDIELCTGCLDFPNGYPPDMREDVQGLSEISSSCGRAYE